MSHYQLSFPQKNLFPRYCINIYFLSEIVFISMTLGDCEIQLQIQLGKFLHCIVKRIVCEP